MQLQKLKGWNLWHLSRSCSGCTVSSLARGDLGAAKSPNGSLFHLWKWRENILTDEELMCRIQLKYSYSCQYFHTSVVTPEYLYHAQLPHNLSLPQVEIDIVPDTYHVGTIRYFLHSHIQPEFQSNTQQGTWQTATQAQKASVRQAPF